MPEIHLRQLGFTYGSRGPFTKKKERLQKFKETGDSRYIEKLLRNLKNLKYIHHLETIFGVLI